jgi:hypothetical protein
MKSTWSYCIVLQYHLDASHLFSLFLSLSLFFLSLSLYPYPTVLICLSLPLYPYPMVLILAVNMTLGNHPGATSGPPVMLDSVSSERTIGLDEYEETRGPRRTRRKLKLSYKDRKAYLQKECGYTTLEIQKEWAEALQIRKQRQETLNRGLLLMAYDDVYESAIRKMNRVTSVLRLQ